MEIVKKDGASAIGSICQRTTFLNGVALNITL